jgi:purine-binding chemotaxis protein CheW
VTEFVEVTKVPNTPHFVEGIINLRGEITPIINLKKRFSKPEETANVAHRVLVLNLEDKLVGFMVDDASQVITMDDSQIQETPAIIAGEDKKYIEGIGKLEERMVIILDLVQVLNETEKKELLDM